ncbi:hypothetical protein CDCA_CDCA03G1030 [Cyanidium caldarium]|uniref:Helicase ATP-binding domain-containing protein n=1 Tax=Cyanidium caldarium TaxID=2771 RepID=A0AAV9ISD0_CYACA|nr:hypothetical protein CDCA_CDCA03G1030 [Cyanidium caldarium]
MESSTGTPATTGDPSQRAATISPPRHLSLPYQTLQVAGVPVRFPAGLLPYPPQLTLMDRVIRSADRMQHALLESPTGTGKSLALLCASLAWLEREMQKRQWEESAAAEQEPQEKPVHSEECRGERAVAAEAAKPIHACETAKDDDDDDDDFDAPPPTFSDRRDPLIHRPILPRSGARCEDMTLRLRSPRRLRVPAPVLPAERPSRIFYTSRTHAQLVQVVDEFRRTPYAGALRSTLLASRDHYCIHPDVRAVPAAQRNEACVRAIKAAAAQWELADDAAVVDGQRAGKRPRRRRRQWRRDGDVTVEPCFRHLASRVRRTAATAPQPFDIEELVAAGQRHHGCPYYAARYLLQGDEDGSETSMPERDASGAADIVFCPYSYLIDPLVRRHMDIELSGALIIIDEAHNVEETCLAAASSEVTRQRLEAVERDVQAFLEACAESFAHTQTRADNRLPWEYVCAVRRWHTWLQGFLEWFTVSSEESGFHGAARGGGGSSTSSTSNVRVWQGGALLHQLEKGLLQRRSCSEWLSDLQLLQRLVDELHDASIAAGGGHAASPTDQGGGNRIRLGEREHALVLRAVTELIRVAERPFTVAELVYRSADAHAQLVHAGDYRLVLRPEQCSAASTWCWSLLCLNPAVAFAPLKAQARSVILTSGTLAPLEALASELNTEFAHRVECGHVIDAGRQVYACVIGTAPDGTPLRGNYRQSYAWSYQDAVGQALEQCAACVPSGVLCFLPSYRLLDALLRRWRDTGALARICGKKRLVVERSPAEMSGNEAGMASDAVNGESTVRARAPRRRGHTHRRFNHLTARAGVDAALREFYAAVDAEGSGGALLLAVCRGKISEGINFADQYARAVIVVGVPYPNTQDLFIQLKKQYNDDRHALWGAGLHPVPDGSQWYALQAYQAVNQAIGRCIRHAHDHAAVILLDVRYGAAHATGHFSKWIRSVIRPEWVYRADGLARAADGLRDFFTRFHPVLDEKRALCMHK